ncbi:hypothetical protein D3C81_2191260 [compost metagenome]
MNILLDSIQDTGDLFGGLGTGNGHFPDLLRHYALAAVIFLKIPATDHDLFHFGCSKLFSPRSIIFAHYSIGKIISILHIP